MSIRNSIICKIWQTSFFALGNYNLTDLEAAQQAETLRNSLLAKGTDFSIETVLSTERNLLLLEKAKAQGYEVQCIYIPACDENINSASQSPQSI
ncbi:MAG: hypothetical protein FWG10_11590 [Eubacteriaceae bacterium]|nr:hypothetical protein [Eubacteriaceae bacterium]